MPLLSLALLKEKHIRWSPLVAHIDLILTHPYGVTRHDMR